MDPFSEFGVLPSKLRPPRLRAGAVVRPRLLAALDGGDWRPLTLVCAPAGSGKSTLVAQWLNSRGLRHAWLSLDERDDHPRAMLRGLQAALAPHLGRFGEGPLGPGMESADIFRRSCAQLVHRLAAQDEPLAIVLDDFHVVRDPAIVDACGWIVEHLPEEAHLVLISRTRPALPLARLSVRGQLSIVDRHQLLFSVEESREFYNGTMALELSDTAIAALQRRTEGWAAAAQLFALGLRTSGASFSDARAPTARDWVLEQYLTDEILSCQSEDVRRFLLRTSILRRLTPASCRAVTDGPAEPMLRQLDEENLFLIPLDSDGHAWRYHHLFADLLRSSLERSDEDITQLHRFACMWAIEEEFVHDAFQHACESGDWELTASVVVRFATKLLFEGQQETLAKWFEVLPRAVIDRSPWLGVFELWACVVTRKLSQIEPVRRRLRSSLASSELDEPQRREAIANMYAASALELHLSTNDDEVLRLVGLALAHIDDPHHSLSALMHYIQGTVFLGRTQFDAALESIAVAARGAIRVGNRSLEASASAHRVRILGLMGRFAEAEDVAESILARRDDLGHGFAVQQQGWAALCRGEFERARGIFFDAINNHGYLYSNDDLASGRALHAVALEMLGDRDGADVEVMRAADSVQGLGPRGALLIGGVLAVGRGDEKRVRASLEATPFQECPSPEARFWHRWMSVWLVARERRLSDALDLAKDEVRAADATGAVIFAAFWRSLLASVLEAMGHDVDAADARAAVRRSGVVLAERFEIAMASPVHTGEQHIASASEDIAPARVGSLSVRESEVLRLLAQGLSNQDIAERLFVSLATVKTHVRQILRKLDARNRTEAVCRARELGWA